MFGKFLLRVFAGLLAATVVTGGKALIVAGLTIYCTAGLGLLIVLPVAYLIGLVCTIWFIPFGKDTGKTTEGIHVLPNARASLSARAALEGFVHSRLKRGASREMVYELCLRAGWSEEVINAAFEAVQVKKREDEG